MVLRGLRHAEQRIDFREQCGERAAVAHHLDEHLRVGAAYGKLDFREHPLCSEVREFAACRDSAHQGEGLRRYTEAAAGKSPRETRHPQHAQRILAEGRGHVTQNAGSQILEAPVRIDQRAIAVARDGIDGQVTPQ